MLPKERSYNSVIPQKFSNESMKLKLLRISSLVTTNICKLSWVGKEKCAGLDYVDIPYMYGCNYSKRLDRFLPLKRITSFVQRVYKLSKQQVSCTA